EALDLDIVTNQNLGNLDGVESCALAQIIRHDPEIEAIGNRIVLTNSADVSRILANRVDGHGVNIVFRLIGDDDPWRLAQDGFDICRGELFLRLDVHGFRVAAKNRNTNRGRGDAQRRFVENLAGLVDHLQLFLGVTAVHEGVDVRNTI